MKLEGTLDAFSLPDIFSLLSATRKTGTLHVRRDDGRHGAIHLRDGAITGARTRVDRQELGRRLVGVGLVDDVALEQAAERLVHEPGTGLGRMLADTAQLDAGTAREVAGEQAVDAVFDLLRWNDGAFAFDAGDGDPDDLGASLTVEQVVGEARARLEAWPSLTAVVPSRNAVVVVAPSPAGTPDVDVRDWWLLALVDGRRTVDELVGLSGRGEHAVVSALAGLVRRGLLQVRDADDARFGALHRRHALLARLEGGAAGHPADARSAGHPADARPALPDAPAAPAPSGPSVPSEGPEPVEPSAPPEPAPPVPGRRSVRDVLAVPVAPAPRAPSVSPRTTPWPAAPGAVSALTDALSQSPSSSPSPRWTHSDDPVDRAAHEGPTRSDPGRGSHAQPDPPQREHVKPDPPQREHVQPDPPQRELQGATAGAHQVVVPVLVPPPDGSVDTTLLLRLIAGVRGL